MLNKVVFSPESMGDRNAFSQWEPLFWNPKYQSLLTVSGGIPPLQKRQIPERQNKLNREQKTGKKLFI
jgi:hypothetical protein